MILIPNIQPKREKQQLKQFAHEVHLLKRDKRSRSPIQMIVMKLTCTRKIQIHRAVYIFKSPIVDNLGKSINYWNLNGGPLMIYIFKMIPKNDNCRFYGYDRFFKSQFKSRRQRLEEKCFKPLLSTDCLTHSRSYQSKLQPIKC